MPITVISDNAPEIVKIRQPLIDRIEGLNMTGKIDYSEYSRLFDLIIFITDKCYERGQRLRSKK